MIGTGLMILWKNTGRIIKCRGVDLDNRFIVPYNQGLLVKYQAHINVEWCHQGKLIKYMFKYVLKGPDCATMVIEKDGQPDRNDSGANENDEIQNYLACSEWVINVGDGKVAKIPIDGYFDSDFIEIPPELRVDLGEDEKHTIINKLYSDLLEGHTDSNYFRDRVILAPLNEDVDVINTEVLKLSPGNKKN
ncbi:hypothetical protein POM88_025855 [Heracleum sosnowskyi]|uniref:ATP-dependent DNA helicase n=1 Tax=Heracleum sosnowskyi TaxID=360622 RepID=A0AAD8MMY6_9APIA|nr:hypothetical protein POM88_025855 [Heracleum sosnowskyi]